MSLDKFNNMIKDNITNALFACSGSTIDLEVFTPSDMGVGQWRLVMFSSKRTSRKQVRSVVSGEIVMLYNAWNKGLWNAY